MGREQPWPGVAKSDFSFFSRLARDTNFGLFDLKGLCRGMNNSMDEVRTKKKSGWTTEQGKRGPEAPRLGRDDAQSHAPPPLKPLRHGQDTKGTGDGWDKRKKKTHCGHELPLFFFWHGATTAKSRNRRPLFSGQCDEKFKGSPLCRHPVSAVAPLKKPCLASESSSVVLTRATSKVAPPRFKRDAQQMRVKERPEPKREHDISRLFSFYSCVFWQQGFAWQRKLRW